MKKSALSFVSLLVASIAFGDTLTWVGPYQYATGQFSNQWSVAQNWTNELGSAAVPKTGDCLYLASDCTVSGQYPSDDMKNPFPEFRKLTFAGKQQAIGGTRVLLQAGNDGIWQLGGLTCYFGLGFPSGETLFYVESGKSFYSTETIASDANTVIVKKGEGDLGFSPVKGVPPTVKIQEGTAGLKNGSKTLTGFKLIYDGPKADFYVYNQAIELKNFDLIETENASASTHILRPQYYSAATSMKFTGTPKSNPIVFTGQLTQNGVWEWAPDSSESEWVFSKASSSFYGTLMVTSGKVAVRDNAKFTQVKSLQVATGATLNVEKGSCIFVTSEATIGETKLKTGECYRGSDGNVAGLTGEGWVVMRIPNKTGDDATATWVGGVDNKLETAGNWEGGVVPNLTSGSTRVIIRPNAGVDVSNLTFDGNLYLRNLTIETEADIALTAKSLAVHTDGGVAVSGRTASRQQVTLDVGQIATYSTSYWNMGNGADFRLKGAVVNGGSFVIQGKGLLHLEKDVIGGTLNVNGADSHFFLHGVTITGNFGYWSSANNNGNLIAAEKGTENIITGNFGNWNYGYSQWAANSQSVENNTGGGLIVVEGGADLHANQGTYNMRFDKSPIRNSMRLALYNNNSGQLMLNAPSNIIGSASCMISQGNSLKTMCPYALADWRTTYNGKSCKTVIEFTGTSFIDLGGYDQGVTLFWERSASQGAITSETPAQLHWNFDFDPYTMTGYQTISSTITNSVAFKGAAGLTYAGAETEPFVSTRLTAKSPTTGNLEVLSGKLTIDAKGSWANAASVKVAGGLLNIEAKNAFGLETAVEIAGDGVINLAYGGKAMRVKSLTVGGVTLPDGVYGGPDSGAPENPQVGGHSVFTGAGRIQVGKQGLYLFLK